MLDPAALGISAAAMASGAIWFQGNAPGNDADIAPDESGRLVSPGWRIGLDIARSCFPELELPKPASPADRRRSHTGAIDELRAEHYNATITKFEPTHSDLWVLRVKPDRGDTSHLPGQYASLGLGYWEARIDDAEDPALDAKWDKLIRRSYSISNRIFDEHGYLADETGGSELEFYIVLVPPTDDNIPALTPRLALKEPGDKIYLGPKVAGRYTLTSVDDPNATVLFLSTGTGEAPHNAMVVELLRKGHVGPIVSVVSVRPVGGPRLPVQARAARRPLRELPLPAAPGPASPTSRSDTSKTCSPAASSASASASTSTRRRLTCSCAGTRR